LITANNTDLGKTMKGGKKRKTRTEKKKVTRNDDVGKSNQYSLKRD